MRVLQTEDDIDALAGAIEDATLEIKGVHDDGKLKKTEKLVETVQGMMNGTEDGGHIVIGLHEDENQEVDLSKKCPVKFPAKIRDMAFEPANFAQYRDHLMKMLRDATEGYREGLCKVDRIKSKAGTGEFIVITVQQSLFRPHRNTNGHFYIRRTEGRTDRMTTAEVETAIFEREIRVQSLRTGVAPKKNEANATSSPYEHPFGDDQPLAELVPYGRRENRREIRLLRGAEEFLWLTPPNSMAPKTSQELKELIYSQVSLSPLGRVSSSWHERNQYGAVVFQESSVEPGTALNMAQIFFDGRLLGIDRFMLNTDKLREFSGTEFAYIPSAALEEDFIHGLENFRAFAANTLKLSFPFSFRAGIAGVKGYAMAVPFNFGGKFAGNMIPDVVTYDGVLASASESVEALLTPFFEKVWLECGLRRPSNVRGR